MHFIGELNPFSFAHMGFSKLSPTCFKLTVHNCSEVFVFFSFMFLKCPVLSFGFCLTFGLSLPVLRWIWAPNYPAKRFSPLEVQGREMCDNHKDDVQSHLSSCS